MAKPFLALAAAAALSLGCVGAAAQSPMAERLSMDRLGDVEPGAYLAGDHVKFTLDTAGGIFLLRFEGEPEVFVLYIDHASLGARVLKYDSGETALRVTGWGGITLYTDAQPGGLAAVRVGDSNPPALTGVSLGDMESAASDESEHLAYMRRINLAFTADWNALAGNPPLRALCFDAMQNAARGIDIFAAAAPARATLQHQADGVLVSTGSHPTLTLSGKTLVVTFNPGHGYEGRASSRAIARALGTLFSVSPKK